ncbi:unnamed protein product [Arabis nemorensis]|uniref:Uncharacterized protein n=1 Tax=Arabis nemorensis TaxID=586526 RepID=A0A565BNE7_9BRAS|nr:unnamed protein product [Arabis nemorensis]
MLALFFGSWEIVGGANLNINCKHVDTIVDTANMDDVVTITVLQYTGASSIIRTNFSRTDNEEVSYPGDATLHGSTYFKSHGC